MSIFRESLRYVFDFRLVEPEFDGNAILKRYISSGIVVTQGSRDIQNIRKDYCEFATDEDAIAFLKGDKFQLAEPVPLK